MALVRFTSVYYRVNKMREYSNPKYHYLFLLEAIVEIFYKMESNVPQLLQRIRISIAWVFLFNILTSTMRFCIETYLCYSTISNTFTKKRYYIYSMG